MASGYLQIYDFLSSINLPQVHDGWQPDAFRTTDAIRSSDPSQGLQPSSGSVEVPMLQALQNGPNGLILWNRSAEDMWTNSCGYVPMNIYDIDAEFHGTFFICHKILLLSSFSPSIIKSCEHGLLFVVPWTVQNQAVSQIGPTGRVDGQALSVAQGTKTDRCFLVSEVLTAACFRAGLPVVIRGYCKTLHA